MSYTDFREDFLTEVEARLAAVNLVTATNNDLLASGALYKMAASVAEAEQIGASTLSTIQSMNATQLQTWLADTANLAAFNMLISTTAAFSAALSSASIRAAIFSSTIAMNAIISTQSALDFIFSSTALFTEFTSSTALTATSVPTMTSASAPSGLVEASSQDSGREGWRAFDRGSGLNAWKSVTSVGEWVQYTFPSPVFIYKATLSGDSNTNNIKDFKIEFKTPKGFVEAISGVIPQSGSSTPASADFVFDVPGKHSTWRITCLSTYGGTGLTLVEADFFGML